MAHFVRDTVRQNLDLSAIFASYREGLFEQVVALCAKAGLVKLGHVALDGTTVKANASKHKAMSYKRMKETEARLKAEVARWFEEAERIDASSHVMVAEQVSDNAADQVQLEPLAAQIKANTGRQAKELSADAGYCTEANLLRKQTAQPVIGNLKSRDLRQFLLRGLDKVGAE